MINKIYNRIKGYIPRSITPEQAKDTGMAMVLISLLIAIAGNKQQFVFIAVLLLLVNMIRPVLYRPVAKIWLGLSHLLGTVMSKIILTVIFFVLVLPVGVLRRVLGKDTLQLQEWKKGKNSVFKIWDYQFTPKDIENPY
ncbi:MAG: SxtJ family membrane protein [Syntrophaceae bacterium]